MTDASNKVSVTNSTANDMARTYRIFSKRPKIQVQRQQDGLLETIGVSDIYWPCCYAMKPVGKGGRRSFEYTDQYFGFIGEINKRQDNTQYIELLQPYPVTLGTDGDDGTSLAANFKHDDDSYFISKPGKGSSPENSFQIHCKSKIPPKHSGIIVGLARHFTPSPANPVPVAAVPYKWGHIYTITPDPTLFITIEGGRKGDIVRSLKNPFEIQFADADREINLTEGNDGEFSDGSDSHSASQNAKAVPKRPTSERQEPKAKDSQDPKQKVGFQNQLPPGAIARGFGTWEQLFAYNFLSRFNKAKLKYYTDQDLIGIAKKADGWFEQVRKVEGLDAEVLASLLLLSLYDCVLLLDDSGSMRWYQHKDGRKDQMKHICKRLIDVDTIFNNVDNLFTDTKGVQVEFINTVSGKMMRTPADFQAHFETIRFDGTTNLGGALRTKILKPRIYDVKNPDGRRKPLLISIITDGQPYPEARDQLKTEVKRCKEFLKKETNLGDKTVVFQISRVGSEKDAEEFISDLENDPDLKNIVDCTSYLDLDPPPDHMPKIEKHAAAIKLLAGAILVNFEEYNDDDWKDVNIE